MALSWFREGLLIQTDVTLDVSDLLLYAAAGSNPAHLQQRLGAITDKLDPGAQASCDQVRSLRLWAVSRWRHLQCTVQMSINPIQMH